MPRRAAAPRREVPFLHEKEIETEARVLLEQFGERFAPVTAPPVPIDDIAELHLQLTLEYLDMKSLFPFADVHGAIWFDTARIGIEQSLDPDANPSRRGRYHFTLGHEVGHWRLHRQHFLKDPAERKLFDDGRPHPDVVCRSSERKRPVEWQADVFSAALLMPREIVFSVWTEYHDGGRPIAMAEIRDLFAEIKDLVDFRHRGKTATDPASLDKAMKEEFSRPMAEKFQVSPEAMRIRLETLELIVPQKQPSLFE